MFLIVSTSLNPDSRSRLLAEAALAEFDRQQEKCQYIDLRQFDLPACDASSCYGHPNVIEIGNKIRAAKAVLIASPVYNYDVSSSAKNLVELTGQAWSDQIVGFLLAAGGATSYMSAMGLANSLMLDFRSLVLPRFVYATPESFNGSDVVDPEVVQRLSELVERLIRVSTALKDAGR